MSGVVVLADGASGERGLWTYDATDGWKLSVSLPDATVIGPASGRVAVAEGNSIHFYTSAGLAATGNPVKVSWGAEAPLPIVAVAQSPQGRLALATGKETVHTYFTLDGDGSAHRLVTAEALNFVPSLAWLDEAKLLILAEYALLGAPRINMLSIADGTLAAFPGFMGCNYFSLSGDLSILIATSSQALYGQPVGDWRAGKAPARITTLPDFWEVLQVATNTTGSEVAMFSGRVLPSGQLTDIHEIVMDRTSDGWKQILDVPTPFVFSPVLGQEWVA